MTIVIRGARVIDGTGRNPVDRAVVVLEGDRIQAVGPEGQVKLPPDGATVVDAGGRTLLPGLMDLHAGIAGLTRLYTPDVALALNARGDALRERLNALCRAHGVDLGFTGLGSLMNLHATRADIRHCDELPPHENLVKDLFFFHMLEQGFYLARRGFIVLSLPLTDEDLARFTAAFELFLQRHGKALLA